VRLVLIVIGVLALVLASCATIPTPQDANDAVLSLRKYGSWAWALGIALVWADLVLPIPQTAVIAARENRFTSYRRPARRMSFGDGLTRRATLNATEPPRARAARGGVYPLV
jgi:hypothetical protein